MSNATCSIDGCLRSVHAKAFCYGHYMKNWRYGTPTPTHTRKLLDYTDQRFGSLVVLRRVSGTSWLCRCDCGEETQALTGSLTRGSAQSCGNRTTHHRLEWVEYNAAHYRVKAARGNARMHPCVDCGAQAQHWSYNHNDPDELISGVERTGARPYSLNQDCYSPRCVPCHKSFDLSRFKPA